MRNYKKRTLALILASTITVAGSFAADNYKNSLMKLDFKSSGNTIVATFHTKNQYDNPINLIKTGSNTYIATFPEINSEIESTQLSDGIQKVDIRTMPRTNNSSGYTKVTITTNSSIPVQAKTALYVPEKKVQLLPESQDIKKDSKNEVLPETPKQIANQDLSKEQKTKKVEKKQDDFSQKPDSYKYNYQTENKTNNVTDTQKQAYSNEEIKAKKTTESVDTANVLPYVFWGLAIFVLIMLIYVNSKKKMAEVVGESSDFDFSDETEQEQKTTRKRIDRKQRYSAPNIKKIDKVNMITGNVHFAEEEREDSETSPPKDEPPVMVDLDELYQEKKTKEESENKNEEENDDLDDLAQLLNEFSFEEEIEEQANQELQEKALYNEELYNQILSEDSISFSGSDESKIQQLLKSEITEETLNEISKRMSSPIKPQKLSKQAILENLITSYSIERNISFTTKDVEILRKLISVEIDPSFVTDLRTNSKRAEIVSKEIESYHEELKKPSEVQILSVKGLLPDMDEEIKKQGNAQIVSEVKHDVVYFNKDYEVSTLHISEELPDLKTFELNDNDYKPSYKENIVASGYEFETLNIKDKYPELTNIEGYQEKVITKTVNSAKEDEELLLKNISNVSFKPFYDGNEDTIINKETKVVSDDTKGSISKINRILKERANDDAQKLLDFIEKQQNKKQQKAEEQKEFKKELELSVTKKVDKEPEKLVGKCIMNNEEYKIVSFFKISDNEGLYLGKNSNSYMVIGYLNDNMFELKKYEELNVTTMQARLREKIAEGILQYLVRIGRNKFIINIKNDSMEYVMDLC